MRVRLGIVSATLAIVAAAASAQEPKQKPRPAETDTGARPARTRVDSTRRADSVRATSGATGGTTTTPPGGSGAPPGGAGGAPAGSTTGATTRAPDPQRGRYRIALIGIKVQRQTYDHLLMLDGKDDEVYFAAHVAVIDTAQPQFSAHALLRSDVYGDVQGFPNRVRAGRGMGSGGIQNGDALPGPTPWVRSASLTPNRLPMLLWEGELVQGQRAVVIAPSVWEWDGNAELFGQYALSRSDALALWHTPSTLDGILNAKLVGPLQFAMDGLSWKTNRIGDPRDRPIGMAAGRPVSVAPFGAPTGALGATAASGGGSGVVSAKVSTGEREPSGETGGGPVVGGGSSTSGSSDASAFFPSAIGARLQSNTALASTLGHAAGKPIETVSPTAMLLGSLSKNFLANIALELRRISIAKQLAGGARNLPRLMAGVSRAITDLVSPTMYFFEKVLVITPASAEAAIASRVNRAMPLGVIEIGYSDPTGFNGVYLLYIQVERIP